MKEELVQLAQDNFADLMLEFRTHPDDTALHRLASRALLEAVFASQQARSLPRRVEGADLELLILHEGFTDGLPYFHQMIADQLYTGDRFATDLLVQVLLSTVRVMYFEDRISKNLVLLILILRSRLRGRIPQAGISVLHARWFARFNCRELSLPYVHMFGRKVASANIRDLYRFVRCPDTGFAFVNSLPSTHVLFLDWVFCALGKRGEANFTGAVEKLSVSAAAEQHEASATRSLLVRQAAMHDQMPDIIGHDSPSVPLAGLICTVSERRRTFASGHSMVLRRLGIDGNTVHDLANLYRQAAAVAINRVSIFFPALRVRRRPKVAVCVSGQLRGYRTAFKTWSREMLPLVDHTIFVHSWTTVGRSGAEPSRYILPFSGKHFKREYRKACATVGFDEIKARYPQLFRGLQKSALVDPNAVAETYGTDHVCFEDDSASCFTGWSNSEKMHYKIAACHSLAHGSGEEFDLMIRIRPDKGVRHVAFRWLELAHACYSSPCLYADHAFGVQYGSPLIGDQVGIGSPAVMDVYANTWTSYSALAANRLYKCPTALEGHSSLAQVCWHHGIDVRKLPMRFGTLHEAEPMHSIEIIELLHLDSQGRNDSVDQALEAAAKADRRSTHPGLPLSWLRRC